MGYEPTFNRYKPTKDVIGEIQELIDGNQVSKNDLHVDDFCGFPLKANLYLNFEFYGESQETKKAGSHIVHPFFGKDKKIFSTHHNKLMYEVASNNDLRSNFLNNLRKTPIQELHKNYSNYVFHEFPPFSMFEDCNICRASGVVTCSNCNGTCYVTCRNCHGKGNVPDYYQESYYDSQRRTTAYRTVHTTAKCRKCSGKGILTCQTCKGQGNVKCNSCSGHGIFTKIVTIKAIARRTYKIVTNASENEQLDTMLNAAGLNFCSATLLIFKLIGEKSTNDVNDNTGGHLFYYEGSGYNTSYYFFIKNRQYICSAYEREYQSSNSYIYIRPPFFDDLFADELKFLQSAYDSKGRLNKTKALKFFEIYAKQPILDKSLKTIAKYPKENNKFGLIVHDICNGYITMPMAKKLGDGLHQIIGKISPTYSKLAWLVCIIPALLMIVILGEYTIQTITDNSLITIILMTIAVIIIDATIIIPTLLIALFASYIHTYYIRKKIPKEYRQKMSNREPLRLALIAFGVAFIISTGYGILVVNGYVPRVSDEPYKWISSLPIFYPSFWKSLF